MPHQQPERPPVPGKAEPEATAAYAARFPELQHAFGLLGRTGLTASHAGFGCYRVDYRTERHAAALEAALTSGVNLIDMSSNYGDGASEMLIASVLRDLAEKERVRREEVILVTKGGYIQGQNYEMAHTRATSGHPFPEVVEYGQGLWHCIHPVFLADQLERSMARMNVAHVDVYLLHNPEYYLNWAAKHGRTVTSARGEYYRRITEAFQWLEEQVAAGVITQYGISSNTFPGAASASDFTSLEQVLSIAESINADHHFRVIQFPMNLFERGGVLERNQSDGAETVLDFCRRHDLGVLINRPLNATLGDGMVRLADFPVPKAPDFDDVERHIDQLAGMEADFEQHMLSSSGLGVEQRKVVKQTLNAGRTLKEYWRRFGTVEHWNNVYEQHFAPKLNYAFTLLQPEAENNPGLRTWLQSYLDAVNPLFQEVTDVYRVMTNKRSWKIHAALNRTFPSTVHDLSLSQKAVLALRSAPGVDTVLVGMRQPLYVQDVVEGLQKPPLQDGVALWTAFGATLDEEMGGL